MLFFESHEASFASERGQHVLIRHGVT